MGNKVHLVATMGADVRYDLILHYNLSVIRGNSGTGKTALVEIIAAANEDVSGCRYKVSGLSRVECIRNKSDFIRLLELAPHRDNPVLYLIDTDDFCVSLNTDAFAAFVRASNCFFLLITRHYLSRLSFNAQALYELEYSDQSAIVLKPYYPSGLCQGY